MLHVNDISGKICPHPKQNIVYLAAFPHWNDWVRRGRVEEDKIDKSSEDNDGLIFLRMRTNSKSSELGPCSQHKVVEGGWTHKLCQGSAPHSAGKSRDNAWKYGLHSPWMRSNLLSSPGEPMAWCWWVAASRFSLYEGRFLLGRKWIFGFSRYKGLWSRSAGWNFRRLTVILY